MDISEEQLDVEPAKQQESPSFCFASFQKRKNCKDVQRAVVALTFHFTKLHEMKGSSLVPGL